MSKPIEAAPGGIPEDVWIRSLSVFDEMCREIEGSDDRIIIARAILAAEQRQREQCARQVVEYLSEVIVANDENRKKMTAFGLPTNETDRRDLLLVTISEDLSDAIRKRGEANVSTVRKSENQEA